ncbi:MAG: PucC family protein [Pseudomonadota bacterium]
MSHERHPLTQFTQAMLPFADAASENLRLGQLLRLSLFQVSVGMATVMLVGTLNRVMIVELGVPAILVALMVALPVLVAPFRAFLGYRSDTHRSAVGWKRVPYIWFGSLWQFGGLAIMPFALLVLSGDQMVGPEWAGVVLAAIAFVMTGLGLHMTQTAGLALAADQADEEKRPRVVALLYVMFLIGMGISALIIGVLLQNFTPLHLIQVVQGTAVMTLVLNLIALWKQEKLNPMTKSQREAPRPDFRTAWADLARESSVRRLIIVICLGTAAFTMQDVLLEPYGGEVLGLSVSATTMLTGAWAVGALFGFAMASRWLTKGVDMFAMGGRGVLIGIASFSAVIISEPLSSTALFFGGALGIGAGAGLFAVSTLVAAMMMPVKGAAGRGLALGAWGAAQATATGLAIALGGTIKTTVSTLAESGALGEVLNRAGTGYSVVYHIEIGLLFATLIALGPMVRRTPLQPANHNIEKIGLSDFPT